MNLSIFVFAVGNHVGGMDFSRVERIEEQRSAFRGGRTREQSIRVGDEIFPLADLRLWFEVAGPPPSATRFCIWETSRRVFVVDQLFEVLSCPTEKVRPLPTYVFGAGNRPFRGIFPYKDQWGLLIEPEGFVFSQKNEENYVAHA